MRWFLDRLRERCTADRFAEDCDPWTFRSSEQSLGKVSCETSRTHSPLKEHLLRGGVPTRGGTFLISDCANNPWEAFVIINDIHHCCLYLIDSYHLFMVCQAAWNANQRRRRGRSLLRSQWMESGATKTCLYQISQHLLQSSITMIQNLWSQNSTLRESSKVVARWV